MPAIVGGKYREKLKLTKPLVLVGEHLHISVKGRRRSQVLELEQSSGGL